jgi:hypothetical protein
MTTQPPNDLLPCPFCGDEAVRLYFDDERICCGRMHCAGRSVVANTESWNTRPSVADQPDDCREAFEKWAKPLNYLMSRKHIDGGYVSLNVRSMWEGWRAAWESRPVRESRSQAEIDLHNLKKVFEAMMLIPDDVTMAEVRQTMKDSLGEADEQGRKGSV